LLSLKEKVRWLKNIAVLISGRGTNLQALIDAFSDKGLGINIKLVLSNNSDAYGLQRAKKASIETIVVDHRDSSSREEHDMKILHILNNYVIDLVVLAGYMRIITSVLIEPFRNKIINIHPSLLPAFPGLHAQKQALNYGVKITGCTTHFVYEEVDSGPIIMQSAVSVSSNDTEENLSKKILEEEYKILVESVKLFCMGKLKIEGKKVIIL
jgi:phosphoribosylglycinamide formyltransferase-1